MEDIGPDPAEPGARRWLLLRDAAEAIGCSVAALRKWRRRGEIESRMGEGPYGPQVEVELSSARRRAARTMPERVRPANGHATAPQQQREVGYEAVVELARELAAARERAARAEARVQELEHALLEQELRDGRPSTVDPDPRGRRSD